jgi:hypothetical protein
MSNSRKKVIIRRFAGDTLPGYLAPAAPSSAMAHRPARPQRSHSLLPLNDIKTVCYVRDFNLSDTQNPERLTRRAFLARPRSEGLWLRLTFRTGDLLEGLAPTDRYPARRPHRRRRPLPHPARHPLQHPAPLRPRSAITELHLLAVITTPSRRAAAAEGRPTKENLQDELFHLPLDPDSRPNCGLKGSVGWPGAGW